MKIIMPEKMAMTKAINKGKKDNFFFRICSPIAAISFFFSASPSSLGLTSTFSVFVFGLVSFFTEVGMIFVEPGVKILLQNHLELILL
jgi:hypothetical protein